MFYEERKIWFDDNPLDATTRTPQGCQMLTEINAGLWIDLEDIYLVDLDELNNELMIYIKMHPKHPIILKTQHDIAYFRVLLYQFYQEKRSRMTDNAKSPRTTENEPQTSENIMEFLNAEAKTRI